jgi:farnesyl-diphosphate farnesyltransferase
MSGEAELLNLLKGVSRSFYISVRFLPRRIRKAVALGYLLARASDTIADTNKLPPAERIEFLKRFLVAVSSQEPNAQADLADCSTAQAEGPEKVLLANIDRVLTFLSTVPPSHRELLNEVLTKIIHGQTLDIERFESKPGIHGLETDSELEAYTYLVAGSVGEFWTKICLLEWPKYARLSVNEMLGFGKDFGKALQLINILRDFPVDLKAGRCYLPVANPEKITLNPGLARPEWERWRQRAFEYLEEAWRYVIAVRPRRVRFACAVPVFIGARTLFLLGVPTEIQAGIKVSRSEVRRLLVWSAGIALFPFLEPIAYRIIFRIPAAPNSPVSDLVH